jgi:hypothetical protein
MPYPNAQMDIIQLGELFMVDASDGPKVQQEIRSWAEEFK